MFGYNGTDNSQAWLENDFVNMRLGLHEVRAVYIPV